MNPIEGFAWANICQTCFVLRMFWNKRCFNAIAFQLCLSVCFRRVQVHQDSLKLNGAHHRPVHADGVYILNRSVSGLSGLCRFGYRLQQNAIACWIYGMKDITSSAYNRYLQSLIILQISVISIVTSEGSKTNPRWTFLPSPKNQRVTKYTKRVQNIDDKKVNRKTLYVSVRNWVCILTAN